MNQPSLAKAPPHATSSRPLAGRLPSWLRGQRGLVVLGDLMFAFGLGPNWNWLVAAGVAPLILSALPCVAMCALGLCMNRMAGLQGKVSSAVRPPIQSDFLPIGPPRSCCSSGQDDAATAVER
ncbi:hypothetical protein CWR43_09670 [Rhizobium sullae]|uniref:Uncharacterized protein n=1 Tax=Rhizobium sullae TaxID=50338 RepID=A0A2N0DCP6_RHISU|nr:hypothetical protein CWR43_09670 [Rhizobium sullae]